MDVSTTADMKCPICLSTSEIEAVLLPCGHYACCECVRQWLHISRECPTCRSKIKNDTDIPELVDTFPRTHMTPKLIADCELILNKEQPRTDMCSCGEAGALFCLQCALTMCSCCAKSHANMKGFDDHKVDQLANVTVQELASKWQIFCDEHKDTPAELLCTKHDKLVCVTCLVDEHDRYCTLEEVNEDLAPRKRTELKRLLKSLGSRREVVTEEVENVHQDMRCNGSKLRAIRQQAKTTCMEMRLLMVTTHGMLDSALQALEETYLPQRRTRLDHLEMLRTVLNTYRTSAEQLVDAAPDSALMGMAGRLKNRLEELEVEEMPDDRNFSVIPDTLICTNAVNTVKKALEAVVTGMANPIMDGPIGDWDLYPDAERPEGTFRFMVPLHMFDGYQSHHVVNSPRYFIQNLPWHAVLFVDTGPEENDPQKSKVAFYLCCNADDLTTTSTSWTCSVSAELRLLKRAVYGGKPWVYYVEEEASYSDHCVGTDDFISWSDLVDPENGYVKDGDGVISLEVYISADEPENMSDDEEEEEEEEQEKIPPKNVDIKIESKTMDPAECKHTCSSTVESVTDSDNDSGSEEESGSESETETDSSNS